MDRRPEDLLASAARSGLELTAAQKTLDESGADFLVLEAEDERGSRWMLRSPRRDDVAPRVAAERRALKLVSGRLPVAVPEWRIDQPDLIAYPRLAGDPAAAVDPAAGGYVWRFDEKQPPDVFLDSLSDVLAALHGIDPNDAGDVGITMLDPAELRRTWERRIENAREVLKVPETVRQRWLRWLYDDAFWPPRPVLVHGDLHPAHILVGDDLRITGILDWTEAHVGDPATDFALLFATMGGDPIDNLLARYHARGGISWPAQRRHIEATWAAYPTVIAEFATLTGERVHLKLAQTLVDSTDSQ